MPLDEGILLVLLHGLVRLLVFLFEATVELCSTTFMEVVFGYWGALMAQVLTLGLWRPEPETPAAVGFGLVSAVAVIAAWYWGGEGEGWAAACSHIHILNCEYA